MITNSTPTIVLIGSHGAGKTTVGRGIARALGWRFDDEIGERLRRQALARDPLAHAALPQSHFDRAVIEEELRRDREVAEQGPRIVETWHLGNLAYARQRSPEIGTAYQDEITAAVRRAQSQGPVWVQPLKIDEATLRARQSEPGPPEIAKFFLKVGDEACAVARELGLHVETALDTTCISSEQCVKKLLRLIGQLHQGSPAGSNMAL